MEMEAASELFTTNTLDDKPETLCDLLLPASGLSRVHTATVFLLSLGLSCPAQAVLA